MRARILLRVGTNRNKLLEGTRRNSAPPLAVIFVSGDDPASVAMADDVGRSRPGTPRLIVSWGQVEEKRFREVREFVALDPARPWSSLRGLRRKLSGRSIEVAVFRLIPDAPAAQRWAAATVTWRKLLACNDDGESHPLDWRHPIVAYRFLRGVPEADIRLPTRLSFPREWLVGTHVAALLAVWLLRGTRKTLPGLDARPASEGCAVLCAPSADAAQLDRHVAESSSTELVANYEPLLPEPHIVDAMRRRLHEPGVWLVWARGSFKHVLGEGWAPHRPRESGTFCLGANSRLFAFRRDVFLDLGGLEAFERQLPGQGWTALSLRAWLRGYKTVYAGDIDFRGLKTTQPVAQHVTGPPLASLLPFCDNVGTARRLLHRHARTAEFRRAYRDATRRLALPRGKGKTTGNLAVLAEPGAVIFSGRDTGKRLRLAMVAPELPSPTAGRGVARAHHLLRRIAEHCDVFLFVYAQATESQVEPLLDSCARVVWIQPDVDSAPAAARRLPAGVARFQSLAMRRHLEVLLEDWRIPLVEVEGTRLASVGPWLRRAQARTILAAPELRFALDRQALESPLVAEAGFPKRDTALWRRYESRCLHRFDCIVAASDRDRELLEQRIPKEQLRTIENGVDVEHFGNEEPGPGEDSVLWIGEFEDAVNVLAFQAVTQQIWPRVRRERPRAELTVVAGADYRLHWRRRFLRGLPELPPDITVLGHVGDLRPLYQRAAVVLAPLPAGGAASPRILEALAMSRPVVAAKTACEGLSLQPERDLLVAHEPWEFADAIVKLLGDDKLRQKLGRQGRASVRAKYEWTRSAKQQLEIYEELSRKA